MTCIFDRPDLAYPVTHAQGLERSIVSSQRLLARPGERGTLCNNFFDRRTSPFCKVAGAPRGRQAVKPKGVQLHNLENLRIESC